MSAVSHCTLCSKEQSFDGLCLDCLVYETGHWVPALGHAIARFVRRAEVAGLVEDVMDCANDMVGAAESYSPFVLRSATANMRVALDRLARLAEEVSGG